MRSRRRCLHVATIPDRPCCLQILCNMMGNCLSIKVDTKRRVWVRRRRQLSNNLRQQNPHPSHGTIYSEALPRTTKGRKRRSRLSNNIQPNYVPVTSSGQPMQWPPNINHTQQYPPQPTAPAQPIPIQAMPTQQNATQPAPVNTISQQPTTGMDPDMARSLLQDT
jgi:hypothetical protein